MAKWVEVPAEVATHHRYFGVKGLALVFAILVPLMPLLGLLSSLGVLGSLVERGDLQWIDYLLPLLYLIFTFGAGYVVILLARHDVRTVRAFVMFMLLGPLISIAVHSFWMIAAGRPISSQQALVTFLATIMHWGVWAAIWIPYLLRSRRINITLFKRLRESDKEDVWVGSV